MRKLMLWLLLMLAAAAPACAEMVISEVMASNGVYVNGEAYDWLELYNTGSKTVDLSGCYLSDNPEKPAKWAFPEGAKLKAGGYLLVYCTGKKPNNTAKAPYYASFKISASGDQLLLTDRDGTTRITSLIVPAQYGNVSWGLPTGGSEYGYFAQATPGEKNPKAAYTARTDAPEILTPGGFYAEEVTVSVDAPAGAVLRYTLDGSTPTEKSKKFPEKGLAFSKTGVLRVGAFREDQVPSPVVSASYFIGESQPAAVVSLITDEKYLFNKKTGALVKGSNADYPNYEREWEYPTNIEFFALGGECQLNQMGTFTLSLIHI